MIVASCLDCGNIRLTRQQIRVQQAESGRWKCPKCHRETKCFDVPDVSLTFPCLFCKKAVTLQSLWDERHRAFFCNPFCVMDYDDAVKGCMRGGRDKVKQ